MYWIRRIVFCVVVLSSFEVVQAQYFGFSSQPDSFAVDVIKNLSRRNSESLDKVAYDFRNVWDRDLSNSQKASVIAIAEKMRKRRMRANPYFINFFSLLTYSLTQENANKEEFSNLLDICHHALDFYEQREVAEFFRTLTFFFARDHLFFSRYNKLTGSGGSYKIELLDEKVPEKPDLLARLEEETVEEDTTDIISEEEFAEDYADNYEEDSSEDDWGSDDDWGSNDDWGSDSDDGWGSSDDSWGASDDYDPIEEEEEEPEEAEEVFVRPTFQIEKPDLVANAKAEDIDAPLHGPVIHITGMDMKMATPYDTLTIMNVTGSYVIRDKMFVGTNAEIDWPDDLKGTDGAVVYLEGFSFKASVPFIKTTRAKMLFPQLFADSLEGTFAFKSYKHSPKTRKFPSFISHYAETELEMPTDNMKYTGGFAMVADQKYGMSVSRKPSKLTITDGQGRTIASKAEKYIFEDSVIRSTHSHFVLYHGEDSIFHPAVQFDYDAGKEHLILLSEKGDFKHTYYISSFFRMEFKADMLEWNLKADSLDVKILNARNRIPAVFESEEYFNPIRFEKMSGLFGFHPIRTVIYYARKVQDAQFNILELQDTYGFDPDRILAAMLFLQQNGYIDYDSETGHIKVLRKAFHYNLAYDKKKDYDNILISSLSTGRSNATLNFGRGEMDVRGIKKIYITPDQDVNITPDSSVVTLLKDKDIKFHGHVNAGDFQYIGHNFTFKYDDYLVEMPIIDSIRIQVAIDSTQRETHKKTSLHNHLAETSGTLYINDPKNKAGLRKYVQYPYFVSDSEAIVYFDSPDVLDGAYDRSVYFIVPPFEMDSINREDFTGIGFDGTFHSGGILPPIEEKLVIMPDKSLGFEHKVVEEGYQLYQGEGTLYDSLYLSNGGLRANGRIDYQTTTINSNDFIFYMDSVSAIGQSGVIREGQMDEASYPEAVLGKLKMHWLPMKDSMYVDNIEDSFDFYNNTASLDGEANITAHGVFGSGVMISRGSRTESDEYQFQQYKYSGRHAKFEVLTDDPDKPAMEGDDIALYFDLELNIADVHPEQIGVAAISFPYAQMKTSMSDATWYLDSAKIQMSKQEGVAIENSYFYTTRKELDSLAFNATDAIYDINTYELNIQGIPFIKVADAEIIPDNNETTILENSTLQPFNNAKVKIDTLTGYHNLFDGNITIISRKKFEGSATYELVNSAEDTFAIKFHEFQFQGFLVGKDEYDSMTVSGGTIPADLNVHASPGFQFKGDVTMFANRPSLEMEGYVRPLISSLGEFDYWIEYQNPGDTSEVFVDIGSSKTEKGEPVVAGLLYDDITYHVYMAFAHDKKRPEDSYLFKAEGNMYHDFALGDFVIETPSKTRQETYNGKTFIYNDLTKKLTFEGEMNMIKNTEDFSIRTTMLGFATPDSNQYFMDAMMAINMKIHPSLINAMSLDVLDMVERLGADVAHDNSVEVIYKLADMIGDMPAKNYENATLNDYVPLISSSPELNKTLVLSNVDLDWSIKHKTWYNTSKIGVSNIQLNDVNAEVGGFIEIKKADDGSDIFHLFLQFAPTSWYYFGYHDNQLVLYSSNDEFNSLVTEHSTIGKAGFGSFTSVIGDEFEVLNFINEYRKNFFGITEPYSLEFPDETHVDEEETATEDINAVDDSFEEEDDEEEDEDDGF